MSNDLVKRLRDGCSCDIDSSPCMAEEECRDAYAAADRIEELEADLRYANKRIEHAFERNDRQAQTIDNLTTKLAKAVGLLESWINVAAHCTIEEGVCCCGDNMDTHAGPMDCGHSPVDHGAYVASGLVEAVKVLLDATEPKILGGTGDER